MSNSSADKSFPAVPWAFLARVLGILLVLTLVLGVLFRMIFVTYIEQHELPYKYDRLTGEVTLLPRTGYIVTPPFLVDVYGIDLRPHQVLLRAGGYGDSSAVGAGANNRVLNAKLVQFNPEGLKDFIGLHGLQHGNVSEILKIYAYDQQGRSFLFLKVEGQTSFAPPAAVKP